MSAEHLSFQVNAETPSVEHESDKHEAGAHSFAHPTPQNAPGARAAKGHVLENSIPLSIFPIAPDKFVFCFCGLPGRGKTHISRRLGRYLEFFHAVPVRVFNVADYRRQLCGGLKDADWFDSNNAEAMVLRNQCNQTCINDMATFLASCDNGVAILDSTNPTHHRRQFLLSQMHAIGAKVMFIEVSNEDESFLARQYQSTVQTSVDYAGLSNTSSELDYRKKVDNYKSYFEPLDSGANKAIETRWSYMKADHSTQHFVVHNVKGYLQQKVVNFIMNLRTTSHAFYLTRHGQSEYNDLGRIGGDSGLTEHGLRYARQLATFVEEQIVRDKDTGLEVPARLWTSTMRRTKETAQFIKQTKILLRSQTQPSYANVESIPANANSTAGSGNGSIVNNEKEIVEYEWVQMRPRAWHHLDELFAGSCDGMTYEEIEERFPEEWERRNVDKLAYRYPRGESYLDVIARLEPIIIEMERHQEPLLIVAHQAILRIIYAFYTGHSRGEAPYLSIPLNTIIELVPGPVECKEQRQVLYKPTTLPSDGQDEPPLMLDPPSH